MPLSLFKVVLLFSLQCKSTSHLIESTKRKSGMISLASSFREILQNYLLTNTILGAFVFSAQKYSGDSIVLPALYQFHRRHSEAVAVNAPRAASPSATFAASGYSIYN